MAVIDITPVLKFMTEKGGSDLFFSTGASIHMDVEGETMPVNNQKMSPGMVKEIAYSIMSPAQIAEFEETLECNFAIGRTILGYSARFGSIRKLPGRRRAIGLAAFPG